MAARQQEPEESFMRRQSAIQWVQSNKPQFQAKIKQTFGTISSILEFTSL